MRDETNRARASSGACNAASVLYEGMVRYLVANHWIREELGSGWWWKDGFAETEFGEAVEQQLKADGIDCRVMLPDEPAEFWG